MKRIICTILAVVTALSLTACAPKKPIDKDGNNTPKPVAAATPKPIVTASPKPVVTESPEPETPAPVTAAPAEIEAKLKEAIGEGYSCNTDIPIETLTNDTGLDFSMIESYAAKEPEIYDGHPARVIILKVKDGYIKQAVAGLNESFRGLIARSRVYEFDLEKVTNARLYQSGDIVALIVEGRVLDDENASGEAKLKLAEAEYAKIDAAWESIFGEVPENLIIIPPEDDDYDFGD